MVFNRGVLLLLGLIVLALPSWTSAGNIRRHVSQFEKVSPTGQTGAASKLSKDLINAEVEQLLMKTEEEATNEVVAQEAKEEATGCEEPSGRGRGQRGHGRASEEPETRRRKKGDGKEAEPA